MAWISSTSTPVRPPFHRGTQNPSAFADSAHRILELDGLRGVAIALVIICHYFSGTEHSGLSPWLRKIVSGTNIGWSGVDLFFVLSGFLIGGILLEARNSPEYFRTFYLRRIHRIFPVYYVWIFIFVVSLVLAMIGAWTPVLVSRHDLVAIPIQMLFFQNFAFSQPPFTTVWFVVTWSLAVEEQFYLFVPLLIRILSLRRLVRFLFAIILLVPLIRLFAFHYWTGTLAPMILLPCRSDALAMGILLAAAWREQLFRRWAYAHRTLLQYSLVFLLLGAIGTLHSLIGTLNVFHVTVGYTWFALLYSCLLLLVISGPESKLSNVLRWRPLRSLGKVSYCVYIVHFTVLIYLFYWVEHTSPRIATLLDVATILLALIVTLAIASISWRVLESPLIRRGRRYINS